MTEEMLAAGVDALKANFPTFTYESAVRECYLAMRSKDHSIAVDDVRERVARAIAPRLFYEFDCQTMDRAARWDLQSDSDKETLRLLADDAITAIGSQSIAPSSQDTDQ